jgi:hypothetical protein
MRREDLGVVTDGDSSAHGTNVGDIGGPRRDDKGAHEQKVAVERQKGNDRAKAKVNYGAIHLVSKHQTPSPTIPTT